MFSSLQTTSRTLKTHKSSIDKHVLWDGPCLPRGMTKLNSVERQHYSHMNSEQWGSGFSSLFSWKLHMKLFTWGHVESQWQKRNTELIPSSFLSSPFPLQSSFKIHIISIKNMWQEHAKTMCILPFIKEEGNETLNRSNNLQNFANWGFSKLFPKAFPPWNPVDVLFGGLCRSVEHCCFSIL